MEYLTYMLSFPNFFCAFQTNQDAGKIKLAPLNEGGVSELLNKVKKWVAFKTKCKMFCCFFCLFFTYSHNFM